MRDAKTILSFIGDKYMTDHPNYFYKQVVYFSGRIYAQRVSPFLSLSDIFVDQIDIKLVEEQSNEKPVKSKACFFFKN
ncbi:MAG: hypothetical protein RBT19_08685 [Tenuifilaceae bacterium]|jgi:hypothetical protein|uniref:hypothetical protein n=1 Tax=Perlabentimonas gracilis TaxID=2715279 RepID=UPI00140AAA86|nr:hypothetical protein [Perlabentimonas gracilis]MDX9770426.1 hypothetical protein [Tenuifilaceae bacterium]NHB68284.1 hypothetical protein [Perlabentimonas gracilis]